MQKRRTAADALPVPTESVEQISLFRWAHFSRGKYPELALLHHIPNGGTRSKSEAGRFRAEGVKAGVPDICLPVARGGYHGLYIEMKRRKGGRLSADQAEWIEALMREGYVAAVCRGWQEAQALIERYLQGKMERSGSDGHDGTAAG